MRHLREAGGALINAPWEAFAPRLGDRVSDTTPVEGQPSDRPAKGGGILFHPRPGDGRANGSLYTGHVTRASAYTVARLYPGATRLVAAAAGAGLLLALGVRDGRHA